MAGPEKRKKVRSPSYPGISLPKAVEYADILYKREHKNPIADEVAIKHWGLSPKSGSGLTALAALRKFGLLSERDGKVVLSELALDVILAPSPNHERRRSALRIAALSPVIYKEIVESHGGRLPSDESLRYNLERERNFNPNAISGFIRDLRLTFEFANLTESSNLELTSEEIDSNQGAQEESNFPPLNPTSSSRKSPLLQDLTIPLVGGAIAVLRVPLPLSEQNFQLVSSWLNAMKQALVVTDEPVA